jgi:hypothetical protein
VSRKRTIAAAAAAASLAVGAFGVATKKPDCVVRLHGVTTCLRDVPAQGSRPGVSGVLMSQGTPFPATEASGAGCVPVACPRNP